MNPAYIVDIVRSPFGRGREGGALSTVHPVDLLAQVLQALMERTGIDSAEVEDVIAGCVSQIGEQAGNIARHKIAKCRIPSFQVIVAFFLRYLSRFAIIALYF